MASFMAQMANMAHKRRTLIKMEFYIDVVKFCNLSQFLKSNQITLYTWVKYTKIVRRPREHWA